MAKVVITFEDRPEGGVKVVGEPNFETMMMMLQSGHSLTPAQGYAIFALNQVREESKRSTKLPIYIPRVGRP